MLFWLTFIVSGYDNTELAEIGWYAIAIAGLSVLTGVSGQISLGHGAFVAVGAYAAGLMMEHFDLPLVVPLLVGVAVAAVSRRPHRPAGDPAAGARTSPR